MYSHSNRIRNIETRKILKIQPQDTDSLEDRRFRVLIKWYDDYPYTYNDLLNRLNNLLGNGNYTLVVLPEEMELKCLVELTRKQMYADFEKLMDEIVPMNMTMDIGVTIQPARNITCIYT